MSWNKKYLGDLAEFCLGKMLDQRKNKGDFLPYLANVNVRWGEFDLDNLRQMRFEQHELERYGLKYGDIVMCEGGEPGRCAIWKDQRPGIMIQKALHRIRPLEALDYRFLYYSFLHKGKTGGFAPLFTGSTIKHLPRQNLAKVEIEFPPIPIQEHIANILSAYDDLIENNRRRIQLLEQSAHLLYKEWFVHLRFPGHEHVQVVDGLPDGWESIQISSICTVGRGASPRPIKNFLQGEVPWFKIADATASESPFVFETKEKVTNDGALKSILLPAGELILSNSATCGVPNFTGVSGCIHDGWLYFKDLKRINKYFLYCFLLEKQREILQGIGEGATQKNLNTTYIGQQNILLPKTSDMIQIFQEYIEPLFQMILYLSRSNLSLRNARDLLLPRLMNGEVTV